MSTTPNNWYIDEFNTNIMFLAAQTEAPILDAVLMEEMSGRSDFFDQLGIVDGSTDITARNQATTVNNIAHYRRKGSVSAKSVALWLDRIDSLKMAVNPTSAYVRRAAERKLYDSQQAVIDAFTSTAYTGEDGTTSTAYDTTMTVAASGTGLSVAKLRSAKRKLDAKYVPKTDRYVAVTSAQMDNMLGTTEVTSIDYNTVRALVYGEIDTFLGFKFIQTEQLNTTISGGSTRQCPYWHKEGMLFLTGKDKLAPETTIDRLPGNNSLQQIQHFYFIGATRMEEPKVGIIECVES